MPGDGDSISSLISSITGTEATEFVKSDSDELPFARFDHPLMAGVAEHGCTQHPAYHRARARSHAGHRRTRQPGERPLFCRNIRWSGRQDRQEFSGQSTEIAAGSAGSRRGDDCFLGRGAGFGGEDGLSAAVAGAGDAAVQREFESAADVDASGGAGSAAESSAGGGTLEGGNAGGHGAHRPRRCNPSGCSRFPPSRTARWTIPRSIRCWANSTRLRADKYLEKVPDSAADQRFIVTLETKSLNKYHIEMTKPANGQTVYATYNGLIFELPTGFLDALDTDFHKTP